MLTLKVSAIESQKKKEQYFKINYNYSKLYQTAINLNVKKFILHQQLQFMGITKKFKEIDRTKPINNYGLSIKIENI